MFELQKDMISIFPDKSENLTSESGGTLIFKLIIVDLKLPWDFITLPHQRLKIDPFSKIFNLIRAEMWKPRQTYIWLPKLVSNSELYL